MAQWILPNIVKPPDSFIYVSVVTLMLSVWRALFIRKIYENSLRWRHNGRDGVSNHQLHDCLLNRLFRRRSKKTSKLRVTGLCAGNSSGTGEFPAQMTSNAENDSIWWRHHVRFRCQCMGQWNRAMINILPHWPMRDKVVILKVVCYYEIIVTYVIDTVHEHCLWNCT